MIETDKTALICDFAETYHIYDYRALPVKQAAALAAGLGENSRIVGKINGYKYPLDTMLLARVVDALDLLVWFQTEDGSKNRNRPQSVLELLTEEKSDGFDTGEDFDKWRKEVIDG